MKEMTQRLKIGVSTLSLCAAAIAAAAPQYQIIDIGTVGTGSTASQGFFISPNGIVTGRSTFSGGSTAFTWTQNGGIVALPSFTGHNFSVGTGVNNSGTVVGIGTTTLFGSGPVPLIWNNGVVSQLALPSGEGAGRAQAINGSGVVVGSTGGGSSQYGAIWSGGVYTKLSQTTSGGSFFNTAFGINDAGLVIGTGIDPNNAARNVGMVYDSATNTTFEVGSLGGGNGALAFGVGNGGHVVGSAMLNQGSGTPFIWTQAGGMTAIPLAAGTSQGSARAVNASGWAVGTDSSAFAIPFLYDGGQTYRLGDLITQGGAGWDLLTNTSSSALGISDTGIITGTGVFNGSVHAYAMVPVPEPASMVALTVGALALLRKRRK